MTATLPSPAIATVVSPAPLALYRFTVAQFDALFETGIFTEESKVELLAGIITHKMGKGSVHDYILGQLLTLVITAIGKQLTVRCQSSVVFADSKPKPDLWISKSPAGSHRGSLATAADLALVIEVSDSSFQLDRETKLPIYAAAGVPEYWIVDVQEERLYCLTEPTAEGKYGREVSYGPDDTFTHALIGEVALVDIIR